MAGQPERYYKVGEREFHYLGETTIPNTTLVGRIDALKAARLASIETGQPVEIWSRKRMNDYVGSPRWGEIHLVEVI